MSAVVHYPEGWDKVLVPRAWDPKNELFVSGCYKGEVKVGKWQYWYDSGVTHSIEYYDETGKRDGTWEEFHPNGEKKYVGQYTSGIAVGTHEEWYEDGKDRSVEHYDENGNKVGFWGYWDRNGEFESGGIFD